MSFLFQLLPEFPSFVSFFGGVFFGDRGRRFFAAVVDADRFPVGQSRTDDDPCEAEENHDEAEDLSC